MKSILRRHRRLWLIFGAVSLLSSIVITIGYFRLWQPAHLEVGEVTKPQVLAAQASLDLAQDPPQDLKAVNFLLLGYGGAGHQGGYLTDVIQIVHLDVEHSQISFISVPRDLWVELPTGQEAKINQAFTLGEDPNQLVASGGQVTKEMVAIVTGLRIDYFVAVDFVGLQRLIGQELGGITVNVPTTLDDPWYPIKGEELNPCGYTPDEVAELTATYSGFELEKQFECRYEHLYYPQGKVEMEGGDVLKYVRSRHGSAGGDFDRSQRQQAVLMAIRDRLLSLDALKQAPDIFQQLSQHVTTDLDLEVVNYLAPALQRVGEFTFRTAVLSTDNVLTTGKSSGGQFILMPKSGFNNWTSVHQYLQDQI